MVNFVLLGAIAMANVIVSLYFLRFWRATHDRFFLYFAISFGIEGINRGLLGTLTLSSEQEPLFYAIRLCSFLLIIFAIIEKNWLGTTPDDRR